MVCHVVHRKSRLVSIGQLTMVQDIPIGVARFLFALFLKNVEPHISLNYVREFEKYARRKWRSYLGKKSTHYINLFFSFFFESVMLSTSVHISQSIHILQSTNHIFNAHRFMFFKQPFKWALFRGDEGAKMYIKSNIK